MRKAMAAFGIAALGGLATAGPVGAADPAAYERKSVRFSTFSYAVTCEFEIYTYRGLEGPNHLSAHTRIVTQDERCGATTAVRVRYEDIHGIRRSVGAEAGNTVELVLNDVARDITSTHFVGFSMCEHPPDVCSGDYELRTK
jgi:hypothetical protein